ncbi:MAG: poly-gamma-glutamate biosynthesis protein PgsC/CapC [Spirochaetia bacterium]|jgi:poly-gamma-glutamate biosynthesis protein PgsC/CapC|nr:poly-gamma-glutamate biosynthesis protein PgsC/CapC [Spirochaetia bacterium]
MIQDVAIGLGLVVNLLFTEVFGLPSGGFIVPGYLALYLHRPLRLASTYAIAFLTWAFVRFVLAKILVLYGRRSFAFSLLSGFLISLAAERLLMFIPGLPLEFHPIGHLIPGLLAAGMLAEGVFRTSLSSLLGAAIVRIMLVLLGAAII